MACLLVIDIQRRRRRYAITAIDGTGLFDPALAREQPAGHLDQAWPGCGRGREMAPTGSWSTAGSGACGGG
jgi:hypothetical protein